MDKPLSSIQSHYLKKALIGNQLQREITLLSTKDALAAFGPPFKPNDGIRTDEFPLLRFFFSHFIKSFPLLKDVDEVFWQQKVQAFVNLLVSKHISSSQDRHEITNRKRMALKIEKYLTVLYNSAVKAIKDESAKVEVPCALNEGNLAPFTSDQVVDDEIEIDIVAVRIVWERRHLRQHAHAEFIIKTSKKGHSDVYVARRHSAFRKLRAKLQHLHFGLDLMRVPGKHKTSEDTRHSVSQTTSITSQFSCEGDLSILNFPCERTRIELRVFLRSLISYLMIASSQLMHDFLFADPTVMSAEDLLDMDRRKSLDLLRIAEQEKFAAEASKMARELKEHLAMFKEDLVRRDGLTKVFEIVRSTPNLKDLPEHYRKVSEWARISFAATIYNLFVASDNSSEVFSQLKRVHSLLPYFLIRQVMKISNPIAMTRGILDLFLAQPFGQKSLFQRIFAMALNDDIRSIQQEIDAINKDITDNIYGEKLRAFTMISPEDQASIGNETAMGRASFVIAILQSPLVEPKLSDEQLENISKMEGKESDSRCIEQLCRILDLYIRQRDKRQIVELLFDGVTAELLRDMVSIFYAPLAKVYKAANISDKVNDVQAFVDDLITTIDKANEQLFTLDSQKTVQTLMDLVERHEQRFYSFVYQVHTHDDGLFRELMEWIQLFLNFLRDGISSKIDMDNIAKLAKNQDQLIMEIDALVQWHIDKKAAHERRMQQRMVDRAAGRSGGKDLDMSSLSLSFDESTLGISREELEEIEALESENEGEEMGIGYDISIKEKQQDGEGRQRESVRRVNSHMGTSPISEIDELTSIFITMIKSIHDTKIQCRRVGKE